MNLRHSLITFFILSLVLSTGVALAFYTFLPLWVNPQTVQKELLHQMESFTENPCAFSQARMVYFPQVKMEFKDFTANWTGQKKMQLEAKSFKIGLRIFPLLLRKVKIGSIEMITGRWRSAPWTVENLQLKLRSAGWQEPAMRFELEGSLVPISKSLLAKGHLFYDSTKELNWNSAGLEGKLLVRSFNLREMGGWLEPLPLQIENGQVSGEIKFHKEKNNDFLELSGETSVQNFVYQIENEGKIALSSSINLGLNFDLSWNPQAEEFVIKSSRFDSPIGILEAEGQGSLGTGQIQEIRVRGTQIALDGIPQYWIPLKKAVPSNFGFSGISNFEISLRDTWDHLSLHASWDLTPVILTYTHYFSKPKDLPLQGTFDMLLKEKKTLSGDFSLRFPEMVLKGTLTDFDLETRQGQINIITNKFPLKGLESLLIPLQNFKPEGEAKILGNWNGNFNDPKNLQSILNLTVENGKFVKDNGMGIHDVNFSLDYGALGAILKQARFTLGESVFQGDISIYHPFENPAGEGKISASHLEPLKVISFLQEWTEGGDASGSLNREALENLKSIFQNPFLTREPVERLEAEIQYSDRKWLIPRLESEIYGGKLSLEGEINNQGEAPSYKIDLELDRLSLARLLGQGIEKEAAVEGNLFLKSHFEGMKPKDQKWMEALQGEGNFILTNGRFKTFDLMSTLSKIPELKLLNPHVSGTTPFDDVHSELSLKNKKISMKKLALISPKLTVEGGGEMGLEGVLNYRLNVFLSTTLSREVLEPLFGQGISVEGKQLGPIALLLSGRLEKPEVQPDPELLPQFVEQLSRKKPQKALTNFLPEEVLFNPRASNS